MAAFSIPIPAQGLLAWFAFGLIAATARAEPPRIDLWPEGVPGLRADATPEKIADGKATNIHHPYLEVFPAPRALAVGTAIVICPGGGYTYLALDNNGTNIAAWLNAVGITAFILHYRLQEYGHPAGFRDALRAIRLVRSRAAEFGVEPNRVGIFGASAGGHLAALAATMFNDAEGKTGAALDAVSARPDFVSLLYPLITMTDPYTHAGARAAWLGANASPAMRERLSPERHVTKETPPTFIVHAEDDPSVPVENPLRYYQALHSAGVPAEMHLWPKGGHGFGMRKDVGDISTWPDRWASWLRANGWLTPAKK